MMEHLFDVVLENYGDAETHQFKIDVRIIDRRSKAGNGVVVDRGGHDFATLDQAIEYARGAVTAFMEGTEG